jgi:hypothetical protein
VLGSRVAPHSFQTLAVDAVLWEIMRIPPTTCAGARAVIEHLVEWEEDGAWETSGQYLLTLLRSPLLAVV